MRNAHESRGRLVLSASACRSPLRGAALCARRQPVATSAPEAWPGTRRKTRVNALMGQLDLALIFLDRRLDEMIVVGVLNLDVGGLHLGQERGQHVEHD